ncbi:uncharacterized protein E0L32_009987 [Thyridium curvatum]|uniref:Xylanolytic transcriptional activator regulatory domain-containing protein n=1 Tax=Thyridium curvatum TaxID=1093900 RepID=A0A507AW60_9PEZI|nr:uncharacterized protein E0L32_009987 [Thyridium curvatum]TPX08500.1 hypothetical protein E0L32_009987 [Thyridium curvatum]
MATNQHTALSPRNKDFIVSETMSKVLELFHAMDMPPLPVCQSLVEAYFEFCWTWMPVVDLSLRDTAATSLWTDPALSKPESPLLMNALLLAGSRMRRGTKYASSQEYYTRAKILVDMEIERNPQHLLGALCMMQWWNAYNPQDVSTTSSRFWITYAIGFAQQMGLHMGRTLPSQNKSLWKRLWWTLYARDCLIAAAHGRPRIINQEDCSIDAITVHDFPPGHEFRGLIFVHFVKISEILCDLCRALTRTPILSSSSKDTIAARLLEWTERLPDELRLYNSDGSSRPHQFEEAQLHVYFLTALCILYRPRSISTLGPENTAAVLASSLSHRLLEGFQLRDLTRYLAPIFTWCTFVAAIPQLSCSVVPSLWKDSCEAVGDLHGILVSLSSNWPSATFNSEELERLQKIADDAAANHRRSQNSQRQVQVLQSDSGSEHGLESLFVGYGQHTLQRYQQIHSILAISMDPSQVVATNGGPPASHVQLPADTTLRNSGMGRNINCQPSSDRLASLTSQMVSATSDQTYPSSATLPSLSEAPISFEEMDSNWCDNWCDLDWTDILAGTGAHDLAVV